VLYWRTTINGDISISISISIIINIIITIMINMPRRHDQV
jgi:hypothetical protein